MKDECQIEFNETVCCFALGTKVPSPIRILNPEPRTLLCPTCEKIRLLAAG